MDKQEAYYSPAYAKLDTEAILQILSGPAIMDSPRLAALAILGKRGMTEEQLHQYAKPKERANREDVDSEDVLGIAADLIGDALDDLF